MSSSAMASARRRRVGSESIPSQANQARQNPNLSANSKIVRTEPQENPSQSLTPLQILQHHDSKLKDLEELIHNSNNDINDEAILNELIEKKVNALMESKFENMSFKSSNNNDNDNNDNKNNNLSMENLLNDKIRVLEVCVDNKIALQNVKIDEFKNGSQETFSTFKEDNSKIVNLLNSNIENYITSKIATLNETLKPTLERLNSLNTIYENYKVSVEKIDDIIKEFNTLKLLVIKNQTIALETSSDMIKIKEEFKINNEKLNQVNNKVNTLDERSNEETSNNPSHMLLKSLMSSNLFSSMNNDTNMTNINDDLYDEDDDDSDEQSKDDKININMDNNSELLLDETQLEELLEIQNTENIDLTNETNIIEEISNDLDLNEINTNIDLQESLKKEVMEEIQSSSISEKNETEGKEQEAKETEGNEIEANETEANETEANETEANESVEEIQESNE